MRLLWFARWFPQSCYLSEIDFWTEEEVEKQKLRSQQFFDNFRWRDYLQRETIEKQFLAEWEIPDLNLDKNWEGLSFLLAGCVSDYNYGSVADFKAKNPVNGNIFSRLLTAFKSGRTKNLFNFVVIDISEWDGLPLVNAVRGGAAIGYATGYGEVHYLIGDEVQQASEGLSKLSLQGFQQRYLREAEKSDRCPWIDWSEDREYLMEWLSDYYIEIADYYRLGAANQRAMLLYLT